MIIKTDDYRIECVETDKAVLAGKMRLPNPSAYVPQFEPIQDGIKNSANGYTINIAQLEFLNSSGISAFAKLVFQARMLSKPLTIQASKDIPWQEKTISSLSKLYDKLEVELS